MGEIGTVEMADEIDAEGEAVGTEQGMGIGELVADGGEENGLGIRAFDVDDKVATLGVNHGRSCEIEVNLEFVLEAANLIHFDAFGGHDGIADERRADDGVADEDDVDAILGVGLEEALGGEKGFGLRVFLGG